MSTKIIISPIISNNHIPVGIVHENENNCWTLLLVVSFNITFFRVYLRNRTSYAEVLNVIL